MSRFWPLYPQLKDDSYRKLWYDFGKSISNQLIIYANINEFNKADDMGNSFLLLSSNE